MPDQSPQADAQIGGVEPIACRYELSKSDCCMICGGTLGMWPDKCEECKWYATLAHRKPAQPAAVPDTRVVGDGYAPGTDLPLHATVQFRDGSRVTMWRQGAGWSAGPEPRSIDEIAAEPAPLAGELPTGPGAWFKDGRPLLVHRVHGDDRLGVYVLDVNGYTVFSPITNWSSGGWRQLTAPSPDPGCFAGGDAGKEIESLRSLLVSTTLVGVSRDRNFGEFLSREGRQPKGDAELFAWTISRAEAAESELISLRRENADLNRLLADFRADVTRRVPLGEPVPEARVKELEAKLSNLPKSMAQLFDERDALTAKLADAERQAESDSQKFCVAYLAWRERVLRLNSGNLILTGESQEEFEAWLSRAEWGDADDELAKEN